MAQDQLREFFSLYGYEVLDTPLLEPTELYLRKSGGDLANRLYTFTDPGGAQVSLRPEYTASIVRNYLEGASEHLPERVQYAGPVFRYEGDRKVYRQFVQVGAELLGSQHPRADAEILSLSCTALSSLGLSGYRLEMGDLGVFYGLLEALGLSERAVVFIVSSITELRRGEEGFASVWERAKQLRLVAPEPGETHLGAAIGEMDEEGARGLLHGLFQWAEVGSLGQREPSEVVERLLRKFRGTDDPASLQKGLELAHRLAAVRGEPDDCLMEAGGIIQSFGMKPSVLERLKEVMGLLDLDDVNGAKVVLDFGLARGLAYYTGIVFEIRHPAVEASLGGGGRYDGLARALGSPTNVPALGFAYTLEHLLDALDWREEAQERRKDAPHRVLVLAPNGEAYDKALGVARELRGRGTPVEMEVCGMSVEESLTHAKLKGIVEVIAVNTEGKSTTYRVQGE